MRKIVLAAALVIALSAGAAQAQYTGPWTQTWDFSNGLQGWFKIGGSGGYWVDPNVEPNGPGLPDGGVSGGGAANIYAPDGNLFATPITPTNSFVVQVDAYLPNLMPLNINQYLPGNGIQNAGIGAITQAESKHMYVAGRNPDGVKLRDHGWDNTDRSRSWLLEEVGVAKADMWDKWITLQLVYNLDSTTFDTFSGKVTGFVYTPWDSGVHDGPGWYKFGEYDIHPDVPKQFVNTLILGSVVPTASSWTQAQFDNVKFYDAVPEPGTFVALGSGLIGLLGFARRKK